MWDLPGPGLEPMSPALAGRFSTTAPRGKPFYDFLTTKTAEFILYNPPPELQEYFVPLSATDRDFPFQSQCCGWTGPRGSYYDCKMHLSNIRELWQKNKFITHRSWRVQGTPGATSWGVRGVRVGGRERGPAFCIYRGPGKNAEGFSDSLFTGEFKT